MVVNGILFRTRAGCPWRDLPGEYGNWKTVYNRHRRWSLDGMWEDPRPGAMRPRGRTDPEADSTVVRAHQHAAGARHAPPANWSPGAPPNDNNPPPRLGREALGRSRGGLSTKIHLAADRRCRPVIRILTPASMATARSLSRCWTRSHRPPRHDGPDRPERPMADKAYSSAANRAYLRRRGIQAVIPVKEDQKKNRRAGTLRRPAAPPSTRTVQGRKPSSAVLASSSSSRLAPLRQADFMFQGTVDRLDPDLARDPV